jgi:hypothetical protein
VAAAEIPAEIFPQNLTGCRAIIYSNGMETNTTAARTKQAARMTAHVVEQAERVRGLSRAEAIDLVAGHTGATVAQVQALLVVAAGLRAGR